MNNYRTISQNLLKTAKSIWSCEHIKARECLRSWEVTIFLLSNNHRLHIQEVISTAQTLDSSFGNFERLLFAFVLATNLNKLIPKNLWVAILDRRLTCGTSDKQALFFCLKSWVSCDDKLGIAFQTCNYNNRTGKSTMPWSNTDNFFASNFDTPAALVFVPRGIRDLHNIACNKEQNVDPPLKICHQSVNIACNKTNQHQPTAKILSAIIIHGLQQQLVVSSLLQLT